MSLRLALRLLFATVIAMPAVVYADHSHGAAAHTHEATLSASAAVIAAQYNTRAFVGDYQGLVPAAQWSTMRFAVSAMAPLYRITKNGATYYGPGDVMAHGQYVVLGAHERSLGVAMALSAPTGSARDGLGMGHVMVMPAAWASIEVGAAVFAASIGYGRAIGAGAGQAGHGGGPIVDPMNFSELTWSATGDLVLAPMLTAGVKFLGAFATDEDGIDRVTGGARVTWVTGRVQTSAELQGGFVGDPFNVRGVVESMIRF